MKKTHDYIDIDGKALMRDLANLLDVDLLEYCDVEDEYEYLTFCTNAREEYDEINDGRALVVDAVECFIDRAREYYFNRLGGNLLVVRTYPTLVRYAGLYHVSARFVIVSKEEDGGVNSKAN